VTADARAAAHRPPGPGLPDYANEDDVTAAARTADLALLDEAFGQARALTDGLGRLLDRAELGTTGRFVELAARETAGTATWLAEARRELAAPPTRAERSAHLAEQAELHQRLWTR
jgi:hypothetical protein